ncbi:hypothetical protein OH77DRAFT_49082 [Trametes cingulata]|nr:hypothetical protein OH77DRAFT_49082 [Trametes cingulata]
MDPATPVNVAKGAAVTSIAAGTFAALHGLYRGSRHPGPLAISAAVNGGIAGTIFFAIREVVVSPVLQATVRRSEPAHGASTSHSSETQPSWTQLRTRYLLDSAMSGAFTGAVINKWRKGRVMAGARTAALICTLLQLGYNELGVMRVKYVTRRIQETQPRFDATPAPPPTLPEAQKEPKITFVDRIMGIIGFRKLSDEEYLKTLKKQRDEALARIAVLEREREEMVLSSDPRERPATTSP